MAWLLPQRGKPLCTLIANRESTEDTVLFLRGESSDRLSLDSVLCLYVLAHENVLDNIKVQLIADNEPTKEPLIQVCSNLNLTGDDACSKQIRSVALPAILVESEHRVIAGLCASIRYLLLQHGREKILGFRAACLASCAQVSIWTSFCERLMPASALKLQQKKWLVSKTDFPESLLLLELHLRQPVRTHNDKHLKRVLKVDELSHDFVEGIALTLADLLLFPVVHLMLSRIENGFNVDDTLPRVKKWRQTMLDLHTNRPELVPFLNIQMQTDLFSPVLSKMPIGQLELPELCLYSQSKMNTKHRTNVKHKDAAPLLKQLEKYKPATESDFQFSAELCWDELPEDLHPESGGLPAARVRRKKEQISNVVNAVLSVVGDREGLKVVDFCSGGGHIAIVLAYLLPHCTVIMVENKYESTYQARKRVERLQLKNIWFYQCNLDLYVGRFDVGVSLHACGGATDLVIDKCLKSGASFVSVPCCYGGISSKQPNDDLLSACLGASQSYDDLCHIADRNENEEGSLCMEYVDTDRVLYVRSKGYQATLSKLFPLTCTPKNNIIVAIASTTPSNNF